MADLGEIGNTPGGIALNLMPAVRPLPVWRFGGSLVTVLLQTAVDITGALSGTVKREGVAIANVIVRLYYRPTGDIIGAVRSGSDGSFTFGPTARPYIGLDKTANNYFVLVTDPQSSFNAVVYDLVTPV